MDMGGHCIDLLEMFFGRVQTVSCFTNRTVHRYPSEDSAVASLRFAHGALGVVDALFCMTDEASQNRLELYGSLGSILAQGTIGQGAAGEMIACLKKDDTGYDAQQARGSKGGAALTPAPQNTYRAEIEEFSQAILDDREPSNNAALGLQSQRVLAGYHGTNHLTLVGNGTCGNLNHLDFGWRWPQGTAIEPHRIATILGASVFQAYKDLKPVAGGPLRARSEIVELAVPEITPAQVEEAKKVVAETKDDRGANFMKLVRAYRALDIAALEGKPYRVEVQVIALGDDLAWVSLPGEVFVELGLAIKRRSPFAHTFVVELANENIGYIPDRRSYAEGNYEPESARCAAGSGERLVAAAVSLLTQLHPDTGSPPARAQ